MSDIFDRLKAALAERYDVERELGHGGMATVYLASDPKHQRRVAIKVLHPELSKGIGSQRFFREIEIAARLQHPNILSLHDSGQCQGYLYYVMPYVEGETLRDQLDREGKLPIDDAVRLAGEIADALGYAHERGVVHRDVKPENVLISDGHAVIADFGIARAISEAGGESVTESGHAVGTPAYMSPEQGGGQANLDGRTDIYSLGCLLFEMLTGQPPFMASTPRALIARHILEQPPSVRAVQASIPEHVDYAVDTALAKTPADRFRTAAEFKDALDASSWPALSRRRRLRSRLRRVLPLTAAILVAVSAVAVWRAITRPGPSLDPNKVIVFPLAEPAVELEDAGAGPDVAIWITAALDYARPLMAHDGWKWLPDSIKQDPSLFTLSLAREIGRAAGALFYVEGLVRSDRDSLTVILRAQNVEGDSVVARETVTGARYETTWAQLGHVALRELMPNWLEPTPQYDDAALVDRDPDAVALWIQGEREYRASRYESALAFFEAALQADSLLALSALRGAHSAHWLDRSEAEALIQTAVAYDSLLPPKHAHLAHGFSAFENGDADSAAVHYGLALAEDSSWVEAAMGLGEVHYHLMPSSDGSPDSLAEVWFQKALSLDSMFTPAIVHLAEIKLRNGHIDSAEQLIHRLVEAETDSTNAERLGLMLECVRDGPSAVSWSEEANASIDRVLLAAKQLSASGAQVDCADAGFRAVLGAPGVEHRLAWRALLGLQGLLVAAGQDSVAQALLESAAAADMGPVDALYVLDVAAGAMMEERAAEVAADWRQRYGENYERAEQPQRWLMGIWHSRAGDFGRVAVISEGLRASAVETRDPSARVLADALVARLTLMRGDTTGAISRLQALTLVSDRRSLEWGWYEPLAPERLLLARLLLAQGRYQEAYAAAVHFDHAAPVIHLPHLAASLLIRLDAANELNDRRSAARLRGRLAALGRSDS